MLIKNTLQIVANMASFCSLMYKSHLVFEENNSGYRIQQIVFLIWAILLIALSCYWLYSRQQHIIKGNIFEANTSFLRVYRNVIGIYIFLMSIQLLSLLVYLILLSDHTTHSIIFYALYSLLYTLPIYQWIFVMFLFSKNTLSQRAFYRAIYISLPLSTICYIFEVVSNISDHALPQSIASVALLVLHMAVLCCGVLILLRQFQYHWIRKRIINRYVFCVICILMLNVLIKVLSYSHYDTLCLEQCSFYIWYFMYPLLLFMTIRSDSSYWWKSSSQPLLESTQKSLGAIDLFNIVHVPFKMEKLSQIVSSHVNTIPFRQIKIAPSNTVAVGTGATASVYRGKWQNTDIAVKCIPSATNITTIFRESVLASTLSHSNIVLFHGVSSNTEDGSFYLIYEYCLFGDLRQLIVNNAHANNPNLTSIYQRLFYLKDIADGMQFLHQNNFIHRDLKTANVVVTNSNKNNRFRYIAKICDFGVSRKAHQQDMNEAAQIAHDGDYSDNEDIADIIDKQQDTDLEEISLRFKEIDRTIGIGTPAFLAPELLLKLVKKKGIELASIEEREPLILCDYQTDVYSYGMIVYTLITSQLPYSGFEPIDMIIMIQKARRLVIPDDKWQEWTPYVSDIKDLKLLLDSTWSQHPKHRPSFTQVCKLLKKMARDQLN
eukprot:1046287_1